MPSIDGFPVPVAGRKITPGSTSPGPPQHAVDDQPVIHPAAAAPWRSIRQQRLQPRPFPSGQIMTIKHDKVLPAHPLKIHETRPSPLTWDQACRLWGASPAGPPPRPSAEPITAQRRASNTGVIMIAGQKIALGRIHAGRVVTVHVAEHTITIELGGDDTRTIRRTTTDPVRRVKAQRPSQPRKAAHAS